MKCKKCGKSLQSCPGCNGGRSNLTCSRCKTTGVICPDGHFQR